VSEDVDNYRADRALIVRTGDTHNAIAYADRLAAEVERLEDELDEIGWGEDL
jgi:hypothetical protein